MVVAQQRHHVFRVGTFGEPGESAQVAEERSNLSAMAFKLLLATRRHDQISHLRRQEAPQPAHALDFAYLVGDALFELLVQFDHLLGLDFQLAGSKVVVHDSDDRLGGLLHDAPFRHDAPQGGQIGHICWAPFYETPKIRNPGRNPRTSKIWR